MLRIRFIGALLFLLLGVSVNSQQTSSLTSVLRLDSLRVQAANLNLEDTVRINILLDLAWELKSSYPSNALDYGKRALELAETLDSDFWRAISMRRIGVIYWQQGEFQRSYETLQRSAALLRRMSNKLEEAKTLSNIGLVLMEKGHYAKALENYMIALQVFSGHNLDDLVATVLSNIGRVHQFQGKHELAETYFLESLQIKEELGDQRSIAFTLHDMGVSQLQKGEFNLALQSLNQALTIRESFNDTREIGITAMQLGILYRQMGEMHFAMLKLQRAHNLFEEVRDKGSLAQSHYQIGVLHLVNGRLNDAIRFFENSMRIATEINQMKIVQDNLALIADAYSRQGNFADAYRFLLRSTQLKDSLFSEQSRQQVLELQYLYEHQQNLNEIELLRQANLNKQSQIQHERLFRNLLAGGVLVFLILLFFLYNRLLAIGSANELLKKQQEEIADSNSQLMDLNDNLVAQNKKIAELNKMYNEANQRLTESEKHLLEVNATKDKFFSIISHDLRNPFASIVSFSRILQRDLNQLDEGELRELLHELDKSILKINNLLENLLQWSRAQTGRIKYIPEYLALYDLVMDNVNLFAAKAKGKGVLVSVGVSPDTVVYADLNMVNAVLRNLISNALKYSGSGSTVDVSAAVSGGECTVVIKDQGVGIAAEHLVGLWDPQNVKTTYGTHDEKGSGLGLILCKEFVEKNKGRISVESTPGVGSTFSFTLPVSENTR